MLTVKPLARGPISVAVFTCTTGSAERPFVEQHKAWSVSYVQRGSFSCDCRGRRFELVPGSVLLGRPGDEFTCTHDHHRGGDECLAFFIEPALADEMGGGRGVWQSGGLPPLAELIALGELACSAAQRHHGPRVDEVGMAFAMKVIDLIVGHDRPCARPGSADRRRAIDSAHWIEAHAADAVDLQVLAHQAGLSVYHYLRVFSSVLGVTPHQFLLRCRLRRAAQLIANEDRPITDIALDVGFADLSNFVRSFRRAAGVSPRAYRQTARGDRKILQVRIGADT
jgi:AraC family transcriptional regulator